MASLILRLIKGSPLTNAEVDGNFSALNTELATKITASSADTLTNKVLDDISNEIGANHLHFKVKATENLVAGDVVKVTGYNAGENAYEVAKMTATTDVAIGIIDGTIAIGGFGAVVNTGLLEGFDTSAFTVGQILYPNGTGGLTATQPSSGTYQAIAFVLRSHAINGAALVEASEPTAVRTSSNTGNTVVLRDASGNFSAGTITAALSGNATTATSAGKWTTARTLSFTGDATGSGSVDGSANVATSLTLANSGVTAGVYGSSTAIPSLTIDAKGRVTSASTNSISVGDGTLTLAVSGTGLSGSQTFTANQGTNATFTVTSNATSANTASTIVARDASGNFSAGTITATLNGNASTATSATTANSSPLLSGLGTYVWSASTLPASYSNGIQASFVQASNGFQSYGSVMTMNTYSGGGGALQLYVPYSPTYGGTGLQVRFGNYDVSSGNSWTSWKTLLASDNYNSYAPTLTGGGASGTWGISISGNAATATSATNSDTLDGFHASAFINTANGAGNYIVSDTRSTATPTDIGDSGVKWDFKANGTDGLSPGHYWVAQTVQAWGDASGGYINQLAFTGNSMYRRNASIGGTWGSWLTLLDSSNYTSYRGTQLISPNGATVVAADSAMPDAGHSFIHTLGLGPSGNDGHILGMTWAGTTSIYGAQIWVDTDPNNRMAFRSRSSTGVWTGWNEVIHSSNYNNYALPLSGGTLTGRTVVNINGRTTGYTGSNLEVYTGDNTPPGISFHRGGYSATLLYEIDGELYINAWTTRAQSGKLLSSGNYTSYVTPAQYLGTAATKAIAYNSNSISENITIANGQNAYSCGPITINNGYTITVQDGGVWTVI